MIKYALSYLVLPGFLLLSLVTPVLAGQEPVQEIGQEIGQELALKGGIITTGEYLHETDLDAQRGELLARLNREDARQQLLAMGVAPENVQARVAAMSDTEIAMLNE